MEPDIWLGQGRNANFDGYGGASVCALFLLCASGNERDVCFLQDKCCEFTSPRHIIMKSDHRVPKCSMHNGE